MPITYNMVTSRPDDNTSQAGPTIPSLATFSGTASILDGDLVIIYGQYRNSPGITITMSATAGQVWNSEPNIIDASTATITCGVFWCKWSVAANQTDGSNPSITVTAGTLALTGVLLAFSPSNPNNRWNKESSSTGTFVTGSSPFTKLINGITTSNPSTVTVAAWFSTDDNTWSAASSSTGWTNSQDGLQYRNLAGNDQSSAYSYIIKTQSGFTGDVSRNQATLGGDSGLTSLITWYESTLPYSQIIMI